MLGKEGEIYEERGGQVYAGKKGEVYAMKGGGGIFVLQSSVLLELFKLKKHITSLAEVYQFKQLHYSV